MCGNGILEGDEACDDGGEILFCNPDCTLPACGDGYLQGNEACDDGNTEDKDGCLGDCSRWDGPGIAYNVKEYDLVGWKLCWVDTYKDGGDAAQDVNTIHWSCTGKTLLFTCGFYSGNGQEMIFNVVAEGKRSDTMIEVDYMNGERHEVDGVAWGWAPNQQIIGVSQEGDTTNCQFLGQDDQMCWKIRFQDSKNVLAGGGRCGPVLSPAVDQNGWRRVIYQAD